MSSSYPGPACLLFSPPSLPPLCQLPLLFPSVLPHSLARVYRVPTWDWPCSDNLELLSYQPVTLIYTGSPDQTPLNVSRCVLGTGQHTLTGSSC